MRAAWLAILLVVAVGSGGCGGSAYLYGALGDVLAQPRSKDCEWKTFFERPASAHDALGVLAPGDIDAGKLPDAEAAFRKSVGAQVCAAGGDAAVIERDGKGRFVRATVIRLR